MIKKPNFKEMVLAGANYVNALKTFRTQDGEVVDRAKFMNASEADSCIRRQWYKKQGTKPETEDWGYAWRGSHMEEYFIKMLSVGDELTPFEKDRKVNLLFTGADQVSITDKDTHISATPDGVVEIYEGKKFERFGLEFKTIDPRANRGNLPRPAHVTQIKIAMALLNKHVYKTKNVVPKAGNGSIRSGFLVYMDASNYNDVIQFEIKSEDSILEKLKGRASKILRTTVVTHLDREGKTSGECKLCPFKAPCGVAFDAPVKGRANRNSNLDSAVTRYLDIKGREDLLKAEKADCGEEIKQEVISRNVTELIVGSAKVALRIVNGRRSLDRKLVAQAGLDLSPFETVGAPSERLEVKPL